MMGAPIRVSAPFEILNSIYLMFEIIPGLSDRIEQLVGTR